MAEIAIYNCQVHLDFGDGHKVVVLRSDCQGRQERPLGVAVSTCREEQTAHQEKRGGRPLLPRASTRGKVLNPGEEAAPGRGRAGVLSEKNPQRQAARGEAK